MAEAKKTSKPIKAVAKKVVKESMAGVKKPSSEKQSGMSVGILSLDGKSSGQLGLPKEIFGAEINNNLLAQAMRVYQTNLQAHHGHTKTRGEVSLTTAKWFRQKGTGRARHGAKSAPIFVGGGVAMGPRKRKVTLDLPDKMKKSALISALSLRMKEGQVSAVSGLDKATGKTKEILSMVAKISDSKSMNILIISDKSENAARGARNLRGVNMLPADNLNVYQVISHKNLVFTKEAVDKLENRLLGKGIEQ